MKTKPRFFYGYVVVIAAFFAMTVTYGAMYTFGVFFNSLLADFGWTRAMTSGAYSLYFAVHGLLFIVTGKLNDRFGPRVVMTVCGFFLGLGYLLMSRITTVWQLYLFYGVLIAIGGSGVFIPSISTVARWFVMRRGLMTGIVVAGISVGTIIMPPVASWLISISNWRTSYVIVGIVSLIVVVLAAQFFKRDPGQIGLLAYGWSETKEGHLNLQDRGFPLREAIHTRQFWLLCGIFLSLILCVQTIMVHVVIHAIGLGMSTVSAASILVVIGGLGIAGRIVIGTAADRIGKKLTITISLALMSLALFSLVAAREIWMLYLFAVIFGFAWGVGALISPVVAQLFGLRSHGVILGFIGFVSSMGGAIGPVLAGYIFDTMASYRLAFLISGTMGALGAILASLLRPTHRLG